MDQSTPLPQTRAPALAADASALPGHYDELRGRCAPTAAPAQGPWLDFLEALGAAGAAELDQRQQSLERLIRDNGMTYNVYADADGPQRPWALDLLPMLIGPEDWAVIESGVRQRAQLLEAIMADVYTSQRLIAQGLLPQELVQGHPGYLRCLQGTEPVGQTHLRIAAFDLARSPQGHWWVVSQRTQAPSGLGYLLENRNCISLQFPQPFETLQVRSLAASYKALIDAMASACPVLDGGPKRIVLLTPGPYNETYFEHAYLARHLGLSLVEGSDLTVRNERLFLKTIAGLEPVHGVLKRLDDEFLDPLELRADSTLGVPGLLQVVRAGNVLMANAPGSAFLESPALLGFLPALSEHLLGQKLQLPSLATWWCGEHAALQDVRPKLHEHVIKPTYPSGHGLSVIARDLEAAELAELAARMAERGQDHTVQAYLPLSQTPTWRAGKMMLRSGLIRVFALADGPRSWRILPGALGRLAHRDEAIASMQQGGSSADVWVLGRAGSRGAGQVLAPAAHAAPSHKPAQAGASSAVSSRAGENLYWLGRYTERAENTVRLAELTLKSLHGEDRECPQLLDWLGRSAQDNALVLPDAPTALQSSRVFARALIAGLADSTRVTSVAYNLLALKNAAAQVRERLSQAQWQTLVQAEQDFRLRCQEADSLSGQGLSQALNALRWASHWLEAITGAQTDRMMRDDGWRLLSIGRHVERLGTLAAAMARALSTQALHTEGGLRAVLSLFDSTITYQARYQQRRDLGAVLELLVQDGDNPRSLAWVTQTLRWRLDRLQTGRTPEPLSALLPDPARWALGDLCRTGAGPGHDEAALQAQCSALAQASWRLSDQIGRRCFSHAADGRSVGA